MAKRKSKVKTTLIERAILLIAVVAIIGFIALSATGMTAQFGAGKLGGRISAIQNQQIGITQGPQINTQSTTQTSNSNCKRITLNPIEDVSINVVGEDAGFENKDGAVLSCLLDVLTCYMKFDLSSIPSNSQIRSAQLTIYQYDGPYGIGIYNEPYEPESNLYLYTPTTVDSRYTKFDYLITPNELQPFIGTIIQLRPQYFLPSTTTGPGLPEPPVMTDQLLNIASNEFPDATKRPQLIIEYCAP